jgi:hypothetical protein
MNNATHPNSLRCRGSDGAERRPLLCAQRGHCRRYLVNLADPDGRLNETAKTMLLPRVAGQDCHYFMEVKDDAPAA